MRHKLQILTCHHRGICRGQGVRILCLELRPFPASPAMCRVCRPRRVFQAISMRFQKAFSEITCFSLFFFFFFPWPKYSTSVRVLVGLLKQFILLSVVV